ncbi:hypothetical protein Tsubulata_013377, partial [Turnera subulata]
MYTTCKIQTSRSELGGVEIPRAKSRKPGGELFLFLANIRTKPEATTAQPAVP